jgi:hypothetical protein
MRHQINVKCCVCTSFRRFPVWKAIFYKKYFPCLTLGKVDPLVARSLKPPMLRSCSGSANGVHSLQSFVASHHGYESHGHTTRHVTASLLVQQPVHNKSRLSPWHASQHMGMGFIAVGSKPPWQMATCLPKNVPKTIHAAFLYCWFRRISIRDACRQRRILASAISNSFRPFCRYLRHRAVTHSCVHQAHVCGR